MSMRFRVALFLMDIDQADHSKAVKDLLKMGVDCYMSKETMEALELYGHRVHTLDPATQQRIGTWTIRAFPLVHDVPNLGFLLVSGREKLLFAVDTNYVPQRFWGLTRIMLGVSYDNEILMENITCGHIDPALGKRILKNHMSFRTAKKFLEATDLSKVQSIHFLHLSDQNSDAEKFKKETEGMTGKPVYV